MLNNRKDWGFLKKPFDLYRRWRGEPSPGEHLDGVKTTQISNEGDAQAIYISRLDDLVNRRVYDFDSKIVKYEQKRDQTIHNIAALIDKYRELAQESEIEEAVSIVTEEVIHPDYDNEVLSINLVDLQEELKNERLIEEIRESFEKIMELLDFERNSYKYFRDWYIDGRICFESVYEEDNIKNGIVKIIQVDPVKLRKFYLEEKDKVFYELEEVDYINTSQMGSFATTTNAINKSYNIKKVLLDERFITYTDSGQYDPLLGTYVSYLHSALGPMNKLKLLEMSIIIYRLTRAPERRIFYIDVDGMSPSQAEQHINGLINKFKNDQTFNGSTDEVINKRDAMEMTKDFYIPVEGGQSGTRIESLPGAANLGELEDLEYFEQKLKRALKIPKSRWDGDSGFILGRTNEITQEEVKFSKFAKRCRNNFGELIYDLIQKDLLARQLISTDIEWRKIKRNISLNWNKTNHFDELMEQEVLQSRLDLLAKVEPYVGKYFTHKDVFLDILKYDDERMKDVASENNLDVDNLSLMDKGAEGVEGDDDFDAGGDFGGDFDLDDDFDDEDFGADEDFGVDEDMGDLEDDMAEEDDEDAGEFSLTDLDDEEEED